MGLQVVLDRVERRITEVVGKAGQRIPNFGFGEAAKFKHEELPRVTWVPQQGPVSMGDERTSNNRKLWKRRLGLQVRIWCADFGETEVLAAQVFAAFTFVHGGRYTLRSEAWDTDGAMTKGCLGVFMLEVQLAFSDDAQKTVDGTGTPLTPEITNEIG